MNALHMSEGLGKITKEIGGSNLNDLSERIAVGPLVEEGSQAILYPTIAYHNAKREAIRILVQGRVFYQAPLPLAKRIMLRGLQRTLEMSNEQLRSPVFRERTDGFLVAPEPGLRPTIELGTTKQELRRKSKNSSGLFFAKADLPISSIDFERDCGNGELSRELSIRCSFVDGMLNADGIAHFAAFTGVSVISDIDDTIKETNVLSRKEMLRRTFLKPFEPIDGMARAYRKWAERGVLFHYVSSSPWQIFKPIETFLDESGFPRGSIHLRWFRLRDEMFKRWRLVRKKSSKIGTINGIIKRLPGRQFVLVGDSGERDPEIYAKMARKFPQRIKCIAIRELDDCELTAERRAKMKNRAGRVPIVLFRDPEDLEAIDIS